MDMLRVRSSEAYWNMLRSANLHRLVHAKQHQHNDDDARLDSNVAQNRGAMGGSKDFGQKMKTFVGFVQIVSVSDSQFSIPWPKGFLSFLKLLVPFNFDFLSISGVGCIAQYNFFHSFVVMTTLPLIVLTTVYAVYKCGFHRHRKHHGEKFSHGMQVAYTNHAIQFTLWVVLLIYPPLSRRVVEYFTCSPEIDGQYYLEKDYRIPCYSGAWNNLVGLAIVAFLIYPFGIPFYFAYQLYKRRKNLNNDLVRARFGFLYEAYRPEVYLWDVFELLRKFFLTGIVSWIAPGESFQVIWASLWNLLFLIALLTLRPYYKGQGWNLAVATYVSITFTMLLGMILATVEEAQEYSTVFEVLLIGMNASVGIYTVYVLLQPVTKSVHEHMQEHHESKVHAVRHYDSQGVANLLAGRRKTAVQPVQNSAETLTKAQQLWAIGEGEEPRKGQTTT